MREQWRRYGRHYCSRHDYEYPDDSVVERLMTAIPRKFPLLKDCKFDSLEVSLCNDSAYVDPVDQSLAAHQGIRVMFADDARIVISEGRRVGTAGGSTCRY